MNRGRFAIIATGFVGLGFLNACAEFEHQICADRLNAHFSSIDIGGGEIESAGEARRTIRSVRNAIRSVSTEGCNSQTIYALNEIDLAFQDLQYLLTNESIGAEVLLSLFDAGTMEDDVQQAQQRLETAIRILKDNGVDPADPVP